MTAALMRLIVLGKIPGTEIQLSFWLFFAVLVPALSLVAVFIALRLTRRVGHMVNPFYGAPRHLSRVDLIAL